MVHGHTVMVLVWRIVLHGMVRSMHRRIVCLVGVRIERHRVGIDGRMIEREGGGSGRLGSRITERTSGWSSSRGDCRSLHRRDSMRMKCLLIERWIGVGVDNCGMKTGRGGCSSKIRVKASRRNAGEHAGEAVEASGSSVDDRGVGDAMVEMARISGGGGGRGKETRERARDGELAKGRVEVGFDGGGAGLLTGRIWVGTRIGGKGLRVAHFQRRRLLLRQRHDTTRRLLRQRQRRHDDDTTTMHFGFEDCGSDQLLITCRRYETLLFWKL